MPSGYNYYADLLEGTPQTAYYSSAPFGAGSTTESPWGGGYAPAAQQYWSGQYGNVFNQYLGNIGRSLRSGQDHEVSFTEYLDQYPFMQRYSSLSPSMRPGGSGASRYSPTTRYMF